MLISFLFFLFCFYGNHLNAMETLLGDGDDVSVYLADPSVSKQTFQHSFSTTTCAQEFVSKDSGVNSTILYEDDVSETSASQAVKEIAAENKSSFFVYHGMSDDGEKIEELVALLNQKETYEEGLQSIFDEGKKGNWEAICFLFDEPQDKQSQENYKKLFPEKTSKEILLKDFQRDGFNENAYEYYLYQLRPEKEDLAPALLQALVTGFKKVDIYENIMWQLFNDINGVESKEKKEWINVFRTIQCFAYTSGLVDQISNPFVTGRLY